ncbi:hypothetical protein [Taibaiella soli]|uniref:Uncharacterized protein n=1 Tax=Taibaiella soli TaxID=1649169 RepID=A0A2W2AMD3_9BACT|nr:hypothetical protein [Taibaiella soli]PZF74692.1 hypothetical protein DN068_00395 [Taibaiella soli]
MIRYCFLIVTLLLFPAPTFAQDKIFTRKHAKNEVPPKALLVIIPSETNRKKALIAAHDQKRLSLLQDAVTKVQHKIVVDFTDNFHFCPVYFFVDTNQSKIEALQFEGVLLDSSFKPVSNSVLHAGDTGFFVGCYGIMTNTPDTTTIYSNTEQYKQHQDVATQTPSFYVMNHEFEVLRSGYPFKAYGSTENPGYKMKKPKNAYYYSSPYFDISYEASAWKYSATLTQFFDTKR